MSTIQELLVGALRKSGHAVAILDRELKICWEGGMPRAMIGAPVNILWQGAKMARRETIKVLQCLASGNGCQTMGEGKKGGERWRIDFIPLYDSTGELQGFAAVRQCVNSVAEEFSDGLAEMYELLFEMGGITELGMA
jgi:hypothetical protein